MKTTIQLLQLITVAALLTNVAWASCPTFQILAPKNGQVVSTTTPLLKVSVSSSTSTWRFMLHKDPNVLLNLTATSTCPKCLISVKTGVPEYKLAPNVLAAGKYYWKARAGGSCGGSFNSALRSFTVELPSTESDCDALTPPQITSPADGSAGLSTTPFINWSNSSGGKTWRVLGAYSKSVLANLSSIVSVCSGCVINHKTSKSYYAVPKGVLEPDKTVYWMARSGNDCAGSPNSAIWKFKTAPVDEPEEEVNNPPSKPVVTAPPSTTVGVSTTIVVTRGSHPENKNVKVHCTSSQSNYSSSPYVSSYKSGGVTTYPKFVWTNSGTKTVYCSSFTSDGLSSGSVADTISVKPEESVSLDTPVIISPQPAPKHDRLVRHSWQ